jgi:hypothetical protein
MKPIRWLCLAFTLVALSACIIAPGRGYHGHYDHRGYYSR